MSFLKNLFSRNTKTPLEEKVDFNFNYHNNQKNETDIQLQNQELKQINMQIELDRQKALLNNIINNSPEQSSSFPPQEDLTAVNWGNYVAPNSLPSYKVSFQENINQNYVTRISDFATFSVGDNIQLRNRYSRKQAFNRDENYILLAGNNPFLLNATTYDILDRTNMPDMWSNTDALKSYGFDGVRLYYRTLNTSTYQGSASVTVREFTDYNLLGWQSAEDTFDNADKYMVFHGTRAVSGTDCWVVVYDNQLDSIISETNISTPISNVNWVSTSQDGNFIVIQYNTNGSGANQGCKSYNRNLTNEQHLVNGTPHGDLGIDVAGNQVFVHYGQTTGNNSIGFTRLDNGVTTSIFSHTNTTGDLGLFGGHISCRNLDRPGYAYISESESSITVDRNEAFLEIFSIKLDNTNTIERWCKTNARNSNTKEWHQSRAVASPSGTKIVFGSDWDDATLEARTYASAWVVQTNI